MLFCKNIEYIMLRQNIQNDSYRIKKPVSLFII